jgi:hypothetical protein
MIKLSKPITFNAEESIQASESTSVQIMGENKMDEDDFISFTDYYNQEKTSGKNLTIIRDEWHKKMTNLGFNICNEKSHHLFSCIELIDKYDTKHKRCSKHRKKTEESNKKRADEKKEAIKSNPNYFDEDGNEMKFCSKCPNKGSYKLEKLFRGTQNEKTIITAHCRDCLDNDLLIHKKNDERSSVSSNKLKDYKKNTDKDNKKWNLTDDQAFYLYYQNCFYCNIEPKTNQLSGIDRLNHVEEKAYDIDKVVPACTTCNIMIGQVTITKFREMCEHIALKSGKLTEGNLYPNHFIFNPNYTYEYAKSCADNKGQPFNLTRDEFNAVIKNECYYCKTVPLGNEGGIDRLNNNDNNCYYKDNCVSCCTTCNNLKRDLQYDILLDKCYNIALNKTKSLDQVWSLYNNIKKLQSILNLEIIKPLFNTNKNDLNFYELMYLDSNSLSSFDLEFVNSDDELHKLYLFSSFKYLGLYPLQIELNKNHKRIFIRDKITNRYLGYILIAKDGDSYTIKRVLPFGIFYSSSGYNLLYKLLLTSEFLVSLLSAFGIYKLTQIMVRKENHIPVILPEINIRTKSIFHRPMDENVLAMMKLIIPDQTNVQLLVRDCYKKLQYNTFQLEIDFTEYLFETSQYTVKYLIDSFIQTEHFTSLKNNIAKIENLIIKDCYKQGRGMASDQKNTFEKVNPKRIRKREPGDIPQLKPNQSNIDKTIIKLASQMTNNNFIKCQGISLITQKQCVKKAVIGKKYCGDHKKSIVYDYFKENPDKYLCNKFHYASCSVFVEKKGATCVMCNQTSNSAKYKKINNNTTSNDNQSNDYDDIDEENTHSIDHKNIQTMDEENTTNTFDLVESSDMDLITDVIDVDIHCTISSETNSDFNESEKMRLDKINENRRKNYKSIKKTVHDKLDIKKLDEIKELKLKKHVEIIKKLIKDNDHITYTNIMNNNISPIPRREWDLILRQIKR